jgi:hypothetical protein
MRPRGRTWGLALTALACSTAVGLSACGSGTDEPPGATAGDVAPIGELAGPTVRLDSGAGFDNLLAVTVDTSGEGVTLIAGQVELARGGAPEVRIVVDGHEERSAEAIQAPDGDSIVVACGCDLEPGEHDVELQGQSTAGSVAIAARSLVALDGVEYANEPQPGSGPVPSALNGAVLETRPTLVSGAASSLASLITTDSASTDHSLIVAQIGSTKSTVDPSGIELAAGVGGEEATHVSSEVDASTKIDAFVTDGPVTPGANLDLLGNVIGGGSADINLVSLISCPCALETES